MAQLATHSLFSENKQEALTSAMITSTGVNTTETMTLTVTQIHSPMMTRTTGNNYNTMDSITIPIDLIEACQSPEDLARLVSFYLYMSK